MIHFVKTVSIKIIFPFLVLSFVCHTSTHAQTKSLPRPNILWITIEDTSPQFIGSYGNADARTPYLDQLAKDGIRFSNAFSTGTVCSPARTAIITGVKTYKSGTGHHRSVVPIPEYMKGFPYYLKQQGYYATNNSKTDYNIANSKRFIDEAWDESSGKAGWWNRKSGQPFFSVFNFMDSHQSRTMTWSYDQYKKEIYDQLPPKERIGDNDFKLPPIYHESSEMRRQFARVYNSLKFTDNKIGILMDRLKKDHLSDSTIIFFYADHGEGMPRGKTNGINYGYRVPFVIYFPPMYSHLSPWGKASVVTDELIDFEDLAPTIISLAGGKVPGHMTGRILIGKNRTKKASHIFISNDRSDNSPDLVRSVTDGRYFYSKNFMAYEPELRYIRYMEIGDIKQQIRTDLENNLLDSFQKSLLLPRPAEMLFDLQNDPWEMHNLAAEAKYASLLQEYRKRLKDNILKEQDILLLPEYQTNLVSASTTLYEYRKKGENFPVKEIYKAASLSGFRDLSTAQKQIALLKNTNEVARYWAVIGLRAQNEATLQEFNTDISLAMADPYPPVAVTAAAIAYDCFKSEKAAMQLRDACENANMDIALMAINYLLYVHEPAPFVATVIKVKDLKSTGYNVKAACNDLLGKLGLIKNDAAHESE